MISDRIVRQAEYLIDTSRIVEQLVDGYRTSHRGRPPATHKLRLMLIGMFLVAHRRRTIMLTITYDTLCNDISYDTQLRLGLRDPKNPNHYAVTLDDFYNVTRTLRDRLSWVDTPVSDIPHGDHRRRRDVVYGVCDSMMDVFPTEWDSTSYSIDASGIHAWGRLIPKRILELLAEVDLSGADPDTKIAALTRLLYERSGDVDTSTSYFDRRREWEARSGHKTAKDGGQENFFGYHEHTMVLACPHPAPKGSTPPLVRRFRLTAANADVVEPTFSMIDALNTPVTEIFVDKHYSYKEFNRWAVPLGERGIVQHLDLRDDEVFFNDDIDDLRFVGGVAHCPSTPNDLDGLERPSAQASKRDHARFATLIQRRQAYAMKSHTRPTPDGKRRLQCPALAGTIGCPLRPGSMTIAARRGLPVVENPPDLTTYSKLPACCTQQTVAVTPFDKIRKHEQPHYWGSPEWQQVYNRRTYVEGSYGIRKNPAAENVDRGQNQVFGLVWIHLVHTLVNASYNLNRLTSWAARNPDHPNAHHPVLHIDMGNDPVDHIGAVFITAAEYAHLQTLRNTEAAA